MKIIHIIYFLLFIAFIDCSENKKNEILPTPTFENKVKVNDTQEQVNQLSCPFVKSKRTIKNTFPFSESTRIKLLYYSHYREPAKATEILIKNGAFDVGHIKQEVELTSTQTDSLFSLFYHYVDTV